MKETKQKFLKLTILFFKIISFGFIILSILLNPVFMKILLSKEDTFSEPTVNFFYKLEFIFFLIGVILFLFQKYYLRNVSEKLKILIINIILCILSLLLIIFLLEISIRLLAPQQTLDRLESSSPEIFEEGEHLSWQFKPNSRGQMVAASFNVTYKINSLGMRDKSRNLTKERNTKRILVLGDSFTEGFSVEQNQTFVYLLEEILNKQNKKVEIWNAGVDGYAPDTEYVYLKNNIAIIKPDMVLLAVYVGNDFMDIVRNSWEVDKEYLPIKITSNIMYVKDNQLRLINNKINPYNPAFRTYLNIFLLRFSHLYVFLNNKLKNIHYSDYREISPFIVESEQYNTTENWMKMKNLLNATNQIIKNHNSEFIVVIIPDRLQGNDYEWKQFEKQYKKQNPSRRLVQANLIKLCNDLNISCIDLLPEFEKNQDLQLYNLITDIHFNENGHKITSQILSEQIKI